MNVHITTTAPAVPAPLVPPRDGTVTGAPGQVPGAAGAAGTAPAPAVVRAPVDSVQSSGTIAAQIARGNVVASQTTVTDADMATQVTALAKTQMLAHPAASVAAQANTAPEAVLRLLG